MRPLHRGIFVVVLAVAGLTGPGFADVIGDRFVARCGVVAGDNITDSTVTVICGMPYEDVAELVGLALSAAADDRLELMARLDALIPETSRFRVEAIARFLEVLGEVNTEPSRLPDRFAQIADEHIQLLEEVRSLRVNDPDVQALRAEAAVAIELGEHDTARARLEEARGIVQAKRELLAQVLADQRREEAILVREQALLERSRLAYAESAQLFEEAAGLLPINDSEQRWKYLMEAGNTWFSLGFEFGDNNSYRRAMEPWDVALNDVSRSQRPIEWGMTQASLGIAHLYLGIREPGNAHLLQAVASLEQSLRGCTRELAPDCWASNKSNLGTAYMHIGKRENDPAQINQAILAFRAALEVWHRDNAPFEWAKAQGQYGAALAELGLVEGSVARHKQAVVALRRALEELSPERNPIDWASTQGNLGNVLQNLSWFESDTTLLEESDAAYRSALDVYTRERFPINWAYVSHGLAHTQEILATRTRNRRGLEQAIRRMREVADVYNEAGESYLIPVVENSIARMMSKLANM